jgi:hypothetical protein
VLEGIGAADITKLKANGFYTVAVMRPLCFVYAVMLSSYELTLFIVGSRCHPEDAS